MDTKLIDFVNVSLRIRPVLTQDSISTSCLQIISKQPPVLFVLDRSQTYHFDKIFTEEVDQQTVYNETVRPLVGYVKKGYNCTVFAYGQTGTGKTYTMGTNSQVENDEDVGLISRTLNEFFERSIEDSNTEVDISVSFIEIYNEKVFDLLQDNNKSPLIVKGLKVQGFKQEKVSNCRDAKYLLERGNKKRHTAGTKQNANSSRSHAVFTIYCNMKNGDHETLAKLNLVDLAGCESVRKTGNQGSTFQEGVNINKGLLCIGQVMTALSMNSTFIPYRRSIITLILQDSLNTKNFISLIACVNSNPEDCNETIQTLDFAQRVKKMKNKPEVSEVVTQYRKVNPSLFQTSNVSNTPFKRPAAVQQTPCPAKRMKKVPLKTTNDLSGHASGIESPKSLTSISMSSVYSNADVTQQNLSPLIKKYVNAMESSLMNRLETVIKNTLKRPTRRSLMQEEKNEGKENTPKMSWNKIQSEVSKLVRQEIVQLSTVATRAASSPIEESTDFNKIKRILNYDSPVLDENPEKENSQSKSNINVNSSSKSEFKVPEFPISRLKKQVVKRTPSVSPIEFVPRQSLRLSLKRNHNVANNYSSEESDVSLETSYNGKKHLSRNEKMLLKDGKAELHDNNNSQCSRRYSVRLLEKHELDESGIRSKRESIKAGIDENINNQHTRQYSVRLINKSEVDKKLNSKITKPDNIKNNSLRDLDVNTISHKDYTLTKNSVPSPFDHNISSRPTGSEICNTRNKRYSVRLAQKDKGTLCTACTDNSFVQFCEKKGATSKSGKTKLTIKDTPSGKKIAKIHSGSVNSPLTARTVYVLNVMNEGNIKQLEQLHSVGPKTAQQILLFRDIKGKFNKVSDLSEMPGWHGKKFEKFVSQNFLKRELI